MPTWITSEESRRSAHGSSLRVGCHGQRSPESLFGQEDLITIIDRPFIAVRSLFLADFEAWIFVYGDPFIGCHWMLHFVALFSIIYLFTVFFIYSDVFIR